MKLSSAHGDACAEQLVTAPALYSVQMPTRRRPADALLVHNYSLLRVGDYPFEKKDNLHFTVTEFLICNESTNEYGPGCL